MARKIVQNVPLEVLQSDLKRYQQRAIELGATDARIITTDLVEIDDRVRAKCAFPKCEHWGTSANCPPHALDADQARKLVSRFSYAVLFVIRVPTGVMSVVKTPEQAQQQQVIRKKRLEILNRIESEAFHDGHYLAVGFGGGSCKPTFCPNEECRALKGQGCKAPMHARASMEAVGMDVYRMVTRAGWDIYPIARSPSDAPHVNMTGIVLIA